MCSCLFFNRGCESTVHSRVTGRRYCGCVKLCGSDGGGDGGGITNEFFVTSLITSSYVVVIAGDVCGHHKNL